MDNVTDNNFCDKNMNNWGKLQELIYPIILGDKDFKAKLIDEDGILITD